MTERTKKRVPRRVKVTRMLESPQRLETEEIPADELQDLGTGAAVEADIGFSYQPFAPAKCSVHVILGCSQDAPTMDRAAHIALRMARQYALDGMELLREDVESNRFHIPEECRPS